MFRFGSVMVQLIGRQKAGNRIVLDELSQRKLRNLPTRGKTLQLHPWGRLWDYRMGPPKWCWRQSLVTLTSIS